MRRKTYDNPIEVDIPPGIRYIFIYLIIEIFDQELCMEKYLE